jgi:hypothetical protein
VETRFRVVSAGLTEAAGFPNHEVAVSQSIAVINAGSSSIKFALYDAVREESDAVTRTEFGRTKIGKPDSDSGRSGGSPGAESFCSEGPERAAGCEMALNVESVLDGGVNGQEALA